MIKKLLPLVAITTLAAHAFAAEIPAAKLDLAEKTIAAMHMEETMKNTMEIMMKNMKGMTESMVNSSTRGKKLTPEELEKMSKVQENAMKVMLGELSWSKMKPLYVQVYAECYTEAEMKAMTAFYSSSEGASILAKTPQIAQKSMQLMQSIVASAMPKMMEQIKRDTENLTKKATTEKIAPKAK